MKFQKIALIGMLTCLVTACASQDEGVPELQPELLYQRGYTAFEEKKYDEATKYFDEVEIQHPYSIWSARAQIMAAYSFYLQNKYDEAVLALDRFIQLHPGNRNTAYAYYLKGLCYYEQMSDVSREQKMTENALNTFQELLARFPNSIYVNDINSKLKGIEMHLSGKELAIGRYYQKKQEYIPAINRFQNVIVNYPITNQTSEAYYRLVMCYTALGMSAQAEEIRSLLQKQFPDSQWTSKAVQLVQKQNKGK